MATSRRLGVIGGTGLYEIPQLEVIEEKWVETPYGNPSDAYVIGRIGDQEIVFLSRHGRGHRILPHEINYRANIYGLKLLGVTEVLSISAVGSMKEQYRPGDLVVVDQFVDRTRMRPSTFFGDGIAVHVAMADPVCPRLAHLVVQAARETGTVHEGGTYICIEGPQFSTRAESRIYRSWGVDVIGMTNLPEARLAREAELCFATLALVTDYDCWHESEEDVDVGQVLQVLQANAEKARKVVVNLAALLAGSERSCGCATALEGAVVTSWDLVPDETKDRVRLLLARQLDE